jgi:hypothetical protein
MPRVEEAPGLSPMKPLLEVSAVRQAGWGICDSSSFLFVIPAKAGIQQDRD